MRTLLEFETDPEPCPYLPDRIAVHRHRVVAALAVDEFEELLDQGWRKFGPTLYQPNCPECRACRPVRIDVKEFASNRSQRRCADRNRDVDVRFGPCVADQEHVELFNRYHATQEVLRGWPPSARQTEDYRRDFLINPVPSGEIAVRLDGKLVGVALVDVTRSVISGVYHYHDPDLRERGLGTLLMLHVIGLAEVSGRRWAHFGYHVDGCRSLAYKTNFQPCEMLGPDGNWRPLDGNS